MSKNSNIPIAVQQTIENVLNSSNPDYVRFNNLLVLENIKNSCEAAINQYNRTNKFKK